MSCGGSSFQEGAQGQAEALWPLAVWQRWCWRVVLTEGVYKALCAPRHRACPQPHSHQLVLR